MIFLFFFFFVNRYLSSLLVKESLMLSTAAKPHRDTYLLEWKNLLSI